MGMCEFEFFVHFLSASRILTDGTDGTDGTDFEEAYFLSESRILTDGTDCTDFEEAYFVV